MQDEHLTAKEVKAILKMESRTFADFRKRQPMFPGPIDIGPTKAGKPTWRWVKSEIEAFFKVRAAMARNPVEDAEDDE